jgi:2-oxo-4-hydroxy-4-carboxy-5-ureidoimidazoline decarboxylase
MTIAEFNALPRANAEAVLLDCCGCARWAARVSTQRPFADLNTICEAADHHWQDLDRDGWMEAFSHHPQIGETAAAGSESHRRWAEGEQTGARVAAEDVKTRLAAGNRSYYEKFGYIYIVCATGKSAEEMLALLEQRLQNDAARELAIAAEQQQQITRLRLQKLINGELSS